MPLPKRDVYTPSRDTGRQSTGHPGGMEVDQALVDILNQRRGFNLDDVARAIQAAGYARPTLVPTVGALAGLPPTAILTDKDGAPWAAASVDDEAFDRYAPWLLVHHPHTPTVAAQ